MSSINLEKGQKINLQKQDGAELKRIFIGCGWDAATGIFGLGAGNIDLDASVGLFSEHKELLDAVSFMQTVSRDGSIRHSGDNRTGAGDGDDETINVDLSTVPTNVTSLVFVINSYEGQTFDKVKNCFARLVDSVSGQELAVFKLSDKGKHTGLIMAKVYRHNGKWKMAAIGKPCNGATISNIMPDIISCL